MRDGALTRHQCRDDRDARQDQAHQLPRARRTGKTARVAHRARLSTRPEINVFLAAITGALLRWLLLAVLALRRTRHLAPHREAAPRFCLPKLTSISCRVLSWRITWGR
ncbi:hypothetical protein MASSI9I_90015 [Massilia sp. 9I]|nr:hypothetical protein MASSI9I_90015 [Massilia sp. 9I]